MSLLRTKIQQAVKKTAHLSKVIEDFSNLIKICSDLNSQNNRCTVGATFCQPQNFCLMDGAGRQ